jgi:hypothetical protein
MEKLRIALCIAVLFAVPGLPVLKSVGYWTKASFAIYFNDFKMTVK